VKRYSREGGGEGSPRMPIKSERYRGISSSDSFWRMERKTYFKVLFYLEYQGGKREGKLDCERRWGAGRGEGVSRRKKKEKASAYQK